MMTDMELKDRWFWAYPTESVDCDGITGIAHEVYSKSEVDEVLAEKDAEIRKLNLQMWSARCEAAEAECDAPRLARCRYMADKFKEADK